MVSPETRLPEEPATFDHAPDLGGVEQGEVQKPAWTVEVSSYGRGILKRNTIDVIDSEGNRYEMNSGISDKHLDKFVQGIQDRIDAGTFELGERMGGPKK